MNSQNQNKQITASLLVKGETEADWEKTKKYKMLTGTFYTGPFATARGNPNFGYVPMITKYLFLLYAFYYVISKNYKYAIYVAIIYAIGSLLNGIRFYYVNSLVENGEDSIFLNSTVYDNIIGGFISLCAALYILFKKYLV